MKNYPLVLMMAVLLANCGGNDLADWEDDADSADYSVELFVETPSRVGALQLEITHLGRSGGFIGRGDAVDCVTLVEAIAASNNVGERTAKVGLISLQGIRTPAAIMRCGFRTGEDLEPADFNVEVVDASDTNSDELDPVPMVVVSTITER